MEYAKDDKKMIKNFSGTFDKVNETALALINSCKHVYLDDQKKEYVKDAIFFDADGNVFFAKRYL